MRALSRAEMRELDRKAAEELGIPVEALMENAGKAVARETIGLLKRLQLPKPWQILILCGSGYNGGDGLVAARILKRRGLRTKTLLLKPAASLKRGGALINFLRLEQCRAPWVEQPAASALEKALGSSTVIVDALLGTGFQGRMDKELGRAIERANSSSKPMVAVDIPSGLDADKGIAEGPAIRADLTVTMGALKKGFLNPESRRWTGEVIVADIGIPAELLK